MDTGQSIDSGGNVKISYGAHIKMKSLLGDFKNFCTAWILWECSLFPANG